MNRLKPYTIGIITSILFHLPLFYSFITRPDSPKKELVLLIDPTLVECSIQPPIEPNYLSLKPPPLTLPPKPNNLWP